MLSEDLKRCTPARAIETLQRATQHSDRLIGAAANSIKAFFQSKGASLDGLCFVVVGSVGRKEALEASDLDFVPVAGTGAILATYSALDADLRKAIAADLKIKVSKGEDLTKSVTLTELTEADCIGGNKDSSTALTKRILILTESAPITGNLSINTIRRAILDAYAKEDRTSGRHVLSFCNDVARYYKTLCIEYKAKIDDEEKDWCTRNMKLRHSRKIWYFANILSIVKVAEDHPLGSDKYVDGLLVDFEAPPVERLVRALSKTQPMELGRLLESYAMFLQFMSKADNRDALTKVQHDKRYEMELGNPFPAMKFNSDVLHKNMTAVLDGVSASMRDRIISWFLL